MKTKTLLIILSLLSLFCCTKGKDYLYNEIAVNDYYSVSNSFEGAYKDFSEGKYSTAYERVQNKDDMFPKMTANIGNDLALSVSSSTKGFYKLTPSSAAKDFHAKLIKYFDMVKGDFAQSLQYYVTIDCDCPEKRDSVTTVIHKLYNDISDLEDEMLEVQKKYMESIGHKPKERK